MADRVKGITIELNGDATNLSNALKGVNKEVKTTQASLSDVKKLLKLDPTNIELLKQKQKLLGDQVQNTKAKLDELKKAQESMDAAGVDKNSQQYMALRREIIDTESSLKSLEKAAQQSNAVLEQVGAVAGKVASGAEKVSKATSGLSTAAGGALAAIGGMAYKAVTNADELNTLAKQTGFTTAELQKMQYAAGLVDVSVSDITGAAAKMKKGMDESGISVGDFVVATVDADGAMRNVNDVFFEVLEALSQISNETERDQAAMQIFGKSADSLAGIIDDGGAALRAYGDDAERLGLIMGQDVIDSLNETNDKLDTLKSTAQATLMQSGAKALEALLPVLDQVVAVLGRIFTWLGSLDEEQMKTVLIILSVVAAISPIAGLIANIAGAVSALTPIVLAVNAAIAANPAVLIIGLIVAAVVGLAILIAANLDNIKKWWNDVVTQIKSEWTALIEQVKSGWNSFVDGLKSAMSSVGDFLRGLANNVTGFLENAINSGINMVNSLISTVNAAANAIAGLFGGSFGGFKTISSVKIPRFAKGGSISNGTALVGEAGPELLSVSQGRATVQPLTATIDNKSLAALGGGGAQQVNVNVQFSGSLAQLAAVLQPAISAETVRRGSSPLK